MKFTDLFHTSLLYSFRSFICTTSYFMAYTITRVIL